MSTGGRLISTVLITVTLVFTPVTEAKMIRKRVEKIVAMREFDNCPNSENLTALLTSKILLLEGGKTALSGVLDLKRDVRAVTKAIFKIYRCPSSTEVEKCEFMTQIPMYRDACKTLGLKNQIWSAVVENIEPRFGCPFKKGRYTLKSTILNPTKLLALVTDMEGQYTRLMATAFEREEKIGCIVFGGQITTVRV